MEVLHHQVSLQIVRPSLWKQTTLAGHERIYIVIHRLSMEGWLTTGHSYKCSHQATSRGRCCGAFAWASAMCCCRSWLGCIMTATGNQGLILESQWKEHYLTEDPCWPYTILSATQALSHASGQQTMDHIHTPCPHGSGPVMPALCLFVLFTVVALL